MCIAVIYNPGCDAMNFEVNVIFLIKPFFLHDQKVVTKYKYLESENRFQLRPSQFVGLRARQPYFKQNQKNNIAN